MDKRLRWADVYYALDKILGGHDTMSLVAFDGKTNAAVEVARVPHQIIKIAYTYNMQNISVIISSTSITISRNKVLVCGLQPDDIVPVYDYCVVVTSLYYTAISIYNVRREKVAKGCPSVSSEKIHIEIDEEEYAKHHPDKEPTKMDATEILKNSENMKVATTRQILTDDKISLLSTVIMETCITLISENTREGYKTYAKTVKDTRERLNIILHEVFQEEVTPE